MSSFRVAGHLHDVPGFRLNVGLDSHVVGDVSGDVGRSVLVPNLEWCYLGLIEKRSQTRLSRAMAYQFAMIA